MTNAATRIVKSQINTHECVLVWDLFDPPTVLIGVVLHHACQDCDWGTGGNKHKKTDKYAGWFSQYKYLISGGIATTISVFLNQRNSSVLLPRMKNNHAPRRQSDQ